MKSGPSSPLYFHVFWCRKGRRGGRRSEGPGPLIEQESAERLGGEEGGGIRGGAGGELAPRRATKMAPPYERKKKNIKPWWKIEIILIRSDSACQ